MTPPVNRGGTGVSTILKAESHAILFTLIGKFLKVLTCDVLLGTTYECLLFLALFVSIYNARRYYIST